MSTLDNLWNKLLLMFGSKTNSPFKSLTAKTPWCFLAKFGMTKLSQKFIYMHAQKVLYKITACSSDTIFNLFCWEFF